MVESVLEVGFEIVMQNEVDVHLESSQEVPDGGRRGSIEIALVVEVDQWRVVLQVFPAEIHSQCVFKAVVEGLFSD